MQMILKKLQSLDLIVKEMSIVFKKYIGIKCLSKNVSKYLHILLFRNILSILFYFEIKLSIFNAQNICIFFCFGTF